MAQSGQVGGKMSEEELIGLLEKISDANPSKVLVLFLSYYMYRQGACLLVSLLRTGGVL